MRFIEPPVGRRAISVFRAIVAIVSTATRAMNAVLVRMFDQVVATKRALRPDAISPCARFVVATIARKLMPRQRQFDEALPVGAFRLGGTLHSCLGFMLWIVLGTHECRL
ncbi:hypothetical protein XH80_11250 [Bradyrhizobium sp. CCBAU 45384]|nr:hypothetical protein [Bradyrhizobium sp. CCBAU 45384]